MSYNTQMESTNVNHVVFAAEEFTRLLRAKKTQKALAKTANHVKKQKHEAGFSLHTSPRQKTHIPYLSLGINSDSLSGAEHITVDDEPSTSESCGTLLDFHFHPDPNESIIPSAREGDLSLFEMPAAPAIIGIGHQRIGTLDILLMRPRAAISITALSEIEDLDPRTPQSHVIDILEQNGIEAFLIRLVTENGGYSLDGESVDRLNALGKIHVPLLSIPQEFLAA